MRSPCLNSTSGIGKSWQNSAFLLTGLAKLVISGPLQSLDARGVIGHARLANTDGYHDSTRHAAERCVRMSVTRGDASKSSTVIPAYPVIRTVGTCQHDSVVQKGKNLECPRTSQVRWEGLSLWKSGRSSDSEVVKYVFT
jgi:hypothetical protein